MKNTTRRSRGMTKKQCKRTHGSSTAGSTKGECCNATGLDKALAKYPRSYKVFPDLYIGYNLKKAKADNNRSDWFSENFKLWKQ